MRPVHRLLARPGRGRARRRRRAAAGDAARARRGRSTATRQRLLKLVNTLLDFSRLESGRVERALRAGRPRALHRRAGEHVRARPSSGAGLTLDDRLPAAARAGLRRPRDVGEDRPQPALERAEVHVRGRGHGARSTRPDGAAALDGRRHRHRHRPGRAGAPVRALPPRRAARARAPTRAPASAWRWSPSWPSCTAATVAVEQRAGRGQHVHGARAVRQRAPARRPGRAPTARGDVGRRRAAEGFLAEAMRWLEPDAGRRAGAGAAAPGDPAADPGRRRQRRHARVRRVAARRATTPSQTARRRRGGARAGRARDPPDLVLTDVMMPELDGFGLLAALQRRPRDDATSRS